MNTSLLALDLAVVGLALGLLLVDLWMPRAWKRWLGYAAALGLGAIFVASFFCFNNLPAQAFHGAYVVDGLALFFKRFFILAGILVLIMAVDFADQIDSGIAEFYSLALFALSGMMLAASANNFSMLFVSVELITVTFYVLTSFQRTKVSSLEAGIKYLILGGLSTGLTVYGIALVFGTSGTLSFDVLAKTSGALANNSLFLLGLLLILAGLAFKISAFPMQIWAPDVYQGSPTPTTAFLAIGSKAAGFVLLLRLLFGAVPEITSGWIQVFITISAVTILYGNLCAIPQRNIKRLLGYSSIAQAGYLLVGVAAMAATVKSPQVAGGAILYYLSGYLFTVLAAFSVLVVVLRKLDSEDIQALAGLNRRSPLLAATMTLAMVSLAGIPPLAGFFGKFLLIKAALEQGAVSSSFYALVAIALAGVVISIWYYFGVIRAIYWSQSTADSSPIRVSIPLRLSLYACIAGMLYLGIFPMPMVNASSQAAAVLKANPTAVTAQAPAVPAAVGK